MYIWCYILKHYQTQSHLDFLLLFAVFFHSFWLYHAVYKISFPWPGIEPGPQQWKPGVLTTRPPGNSLFCRSFAFLHFANRSKIHLELIFVKVVRTWSGFVCVCVEIEVCQCHLLKSLSFLHCIASVSLSKINSLFLCGSISLLSICSIDKFVYFYQYHTFYLFIFKLRYKWLIVLY